MKSTFSLTFAVIIAFLAGVGAVAIILNLSSDKRPSNPYYPATTLPQCLHTGGRIDGDRCSYKLEQWREILK